VKILMPFMERTPMMEQALESLKATCPLEVITHQDKGEGWVGICNQYLGTDDIILWHTDLIAKEGWYEKLMEYANEFPDIGIFGTKLLYGDDTIQHAGGFVSRNLICGNVGSHELDFGQYDYASKKPFVTFAGVLIRKSAAEKIGKMDVEYSPIYFDDVDYCLRAWELKIPVLYVPVELYHYESQTTKKDQKFLEKQVYNWNYFKAKWMNRIGELYVRKI
jgi:GT2 family glycosyltransferase